MFSLLLLKSKLDCLKVAIMNKDNAEISKRLMKVMKYTKHTSKNEYISKDEMEQIEASMELIDILLDHEIYVEADDTVDKCIIMVEKRFLGMLMMQQRLLTPDSDVGALRKLPLDVLERIRDIVTC